MPTRGREAVLDAMRGVFAELPYGIEHTEHVLAGTCTTPTGRSAATRIFAFQRWLMATVLGALAVRLAFERRPS